MTETTARIRWDDDPRGCCTGYVGTQDRRAFTIWPPLHDADEWMLDCAFSDVPDERAFGGGPDELKAKAEDWLERFVSSLGAVFPEAMLELADQWKQFAARGDAQDECAGMLRETITTALGAQEHP